VTKTNIVIVGGGSSGWSAATYLSKNKDLNITIIEPSDIPIIGVGESTIPFINKIHNEMELSVFSNNKWIDRVNGTLKFSIEFRDYNRIGEQWIHPFLVSNSKDSELVQLTCGSQLPLDIYSNHSEYINDNYVYPNMGSLKYSEPEFQYEDERFRGCGYHIDAIKYAELLKDESLKERDNIEVIDASVNHVFVEGDSIDKLILSNGEEIKADPSTLFVDCTGFKAILANAVGSEWDKSYQDRLFVDSALAIQLPYADKDKQLKNTTACHALKNGWVWHVPLQNRVGTGYVYSSRHTTADEAGEDFKTHLNKEYGYNKENLKFRKLEFDVGIRREAWKNNVVAIGLANSFVEPIESTAIATTHNQISTLYNMLINHHILYEDKLKRFNNINNLALDAIAEYIELHYIMSKRKDSQFWRDISSIELSETQSEVLDMYLTPDRPFNQQTLSYTTGGHNLFDPSSFMFLLLGYDFLPNLPDLYTNDEGEISQSFGWSA